MSAPVYSTFNSSATADRLFDVLTSTEWVDTKAQRFSDGSMLTEHEHQGDGGVRLTVSRELPDGVPGFLQRFLPKDGRVLETFDWGPPGTDGVRHGQWSADIPGAPAKLGGTMRIDPTDIGSSYTIEGDVKVKVPIVGGRAESFIADVVVKLATKEADLLRDILDA